MMKRTKKLLAMGMSVCMILGTTMTAMAEDNSASVEVTAPVYSMNITNVVVPTTLSLAFNPQEYTVKTGTDTTSTAQVVSLNYGIVNKGSGDKTVKVAFAVADQNTTANGSMITMMDTAAEATGAASDVYALYLEAVPVTLGASAVTKDTTADALAGITGSKAATGAVAIKSSGAIGFNLQKANWTQKATGGELEMSTNTATVSGNNVADKFELTALNTDSAAAFTLSGAMNKNADWTALTAGVKVGLTYTWTDTVHADPDSPVYGVTQLTAGPTFTSNDVLKLAYTAGMGDDAMTDIVSVTAIAPDGVTELNIYAALSKAWAAATDENGVITFDSTLPTFWPDAETLTVKVTYKVGTGETATNKTANATLKLKTAEVAGD